jgi:hypothetical protein
METWLEWLLNLHNDCCFQTKEKSLHGKASNSEIRRWFKNNSIHINGRSVKAEEGVSYPIHSVVLFPKSNQRITLW